jgi:hypothetical protein
MSNSIFQDARYYPIYAIVGGIHTSVNSAQHKFIVNDIHNAVWRITGRHVTPITDTSKDAIEEKLKEMIDENQ